METSLILILHHVSEDVIVEQRLNAPLSWKRLLQLAFKSEVVKLQIFKSALKLDCHHILLLLLLLLLGLLALEYQHLLLCLLLEFFNFAALWFIVSLGFMRVFSLSLWDAVLFFRRKASWSITLLVSAFIFFKCSKIWVLDVSVHFFT